jgi:negative regulator of flagellin synthesis FlgM
MKIGHPVDKAAPQATSPGRTAQADTGKAQGTDAVAEASAKVEISSEASSLLSGTQGSSADFDAEKVARISKAIEDGSFKVNHGAIADKLIANAQEVLGKVTA